MKLAQFNQGRIGIVQGEMIFDVTDEAGVNPALWPPTGMVQTIAQFDQIRPKLEACVATRPGQTLHSVRLDAPIAWPNKVIAFPANYHAHIEEMEKGPGLISTNKTGGQGFFLKANSSLSGPSDAIVIPNVPGREVHHECELAIIIGRRGRNIQRHDALEYIFGFCCLVDVVIRGKEERVMRKSFDTFCPIGPYIVTREEIADPNNIDMELRVDGDLRQSANTRDLIVGIEEMITMSASVMTLEPGDIIASGTPAGVGPIKPGEMLTIDITGVGRMSLPVIADRSPSHGVWNVQSNR